MARRRLTLRQEAVLRDLCNVNDGEGMRLQRGDALAAAALVRMSLAWREGISDRGTYYPTEAGWRWVAQADRRAA